MQQPPKSRSTPKAPIKALSNTLDQICTYLKVDFSEKKRKGEKPSEIIISKIKKDKQKNVLIGFVIGFVLGSALIMVPLTFS